MKKILLTMIAIMAVSLMSFAQKTEKNSQQETVEAHRVYRVFANNETDSNIIGIRNDSFRGQRMGNSRGPFSGLGLAIAKSYSTVLVQKSVSAMSNLIDLTVRLLAKNKLDREQWLKSAKEQCHFQYKLASDVFIDDFYYLPSFEGALDPADMKFTGFGCISTLKPSAPMPRAKDDLNDVLSTGQRMAAGTQEHADTTELLEFFVTCKIRDDSVGLSRIINHSKFEVELDQFVFDARHSCLPNDSSSCMKLQPFDFMGRKEFVFNLNVKVFSSWVNEAIMLFDNLQIGEFNITARIDSSDLTEDYLFVYDPAKHGDKVSVTGESFLVPRSYTGTTNAPSWGTGQYRLEITINEDCAVNEKWYQKAEKEGAVSMNKKPRWDNSKWKPEWKEMQSRRRSGEAWDMVWRSVTTAYIGKDWVQELVSPLTTAVSAYETVALGKLLEEAASANNKVKSSPVVPAAAVDPMPTNVAVPKGRE